MKTEINHQWIFEQSPIEVWEYLTQSELIALWLMPNNFKAEVGYEFEFRTNPILNLNLNGIFNCKVLEIIPNKKLAYSWKGNSSNSKIILDTIVEWTLEHFENGTKLLLKHSGYNLENFSILNAMTDGWLNHIQRMSNYLNSNKQGEEKPNIKFKIGVIGAGQIGGTLINQYTKAGHTVKMANASGIEKLRDLAFETGALAVALADVVSDVDVIVISIPLIEIPKLPQNLFENLPPNITIIDTCNYYPIRDGIIKDIENGMPESIWISNQLKRPVVKAYNSILADSLILSGSKMCNTSRLALPISGDNKQSKAIVSILVDDSGFDALDYGSLEDSWKQQPGSPVYCTDLTLTQLKNSLIKVQKEVLPERRELGLTFILNQNPLQWMDCVKYNRIIYESDLETN
jgi:8-hydroxy-5-deazaflavin:NADPH oxidoreductase